MLECVTAPAIPKILVSFDPATIHQITIQGALLMFILSQWPKFEVAWEIKRIVLIGLTISIFHSSEKQ
jgi:hypothetical protein